MRSWSPPKFVASYGKGAGDTLTLHLPSPQQVNAGYDGSTGPPRGPIILARIVGVGRTPWGIDADGPGQAGGVLASPALFTSLPICDKGARTGH